MLLRCLALLATFALLIGACASAPASQPSPTTSASLASASPTQAPAFPATVTDFQGKAITISAKPARIVSIGASTTEFLFALGAGDRVVGVDDFSDEPAAAKSKEKVGGVKPNVEKICLLYTSPSPRD